MAKQMRYPPGTKMIKVEFPDENGDESKPTSKKPKNPRKKDAQPQQDRPSASAVSTKSAEIEIIDFDVTKLTNQMNAYTAQAVAHMPPQDQFYFAIDALRHDLQNGTFNDDHRSEVITANLRETNHRYMKDFIDRIHGLSLHDQIQYYEREAASIENALHLSAITDVFEMSSPEARLKTTDRKQIEQMRATRDFFVSSLNNIKTAAKKEAEDDGSDIPIPKSEAQKIAVMWYLGIVQLVADKCVIGNTFNFRKAAVIISSFTGIHEDTVRKAIIPLLQKDADQKNNPMKAAKTQSFIEDLKRQLGDL
jgi:hypothetical protein